MKLKQTPSQTVGPFFHYALTDEAGQNVLVNDDTNGQRILIKGQVTDGEGNAMPDAMLEIWQADAKGHFNHPADPHHAEADPNFKGFGRTATDKNGTFIFKTIKPGQVAYDENSKQSSHISLRVFARGMLIHAYTRLYFSDESNQADQILQLVPEERRHTLIALREDKGDLPSYCFNISLQGDNETVFFEP